MAMKPDSDEDKKSKWNKNKGKGKKDYQMPDTVWCLDYNRGTCKFSTHHLGRFGIHEGVKKWHICRVCFNEKGEKKFHNEKDSTCPHKTSTA